MKRIISSLLIFAAAACGILEPGNVTLRFEGTVTAQATGQPIAGAQIKLSEVTLFESGAPLATTSTDAQGRYSLAHSVSDNCVGNSLGLLIGASATGFSVSSELIGECNGTVKRFDFALEAVTVP